MFIFPRILDIAMHDRKINGVALAKLTGIPPNDISRYHTGWKYPDAEQLAKIAVALGVSADYLLGLTDDPEPHYTRGEISK
ncbi:hypothetical protein FACS1894105_09230 [Clostridia bacterium]|nr:hypothetical protein FACS1894105_09230 [Clostridia bacterium]